MGVKYNFNEEEIKKMVLLYEKEYKSVGDIAKLYNVDRSVIDNRLRKYGVKISSKSPYNFKHWVERGMSETDAKEHVKLIRPVTTEYWLNLGYSEDEAETKKKAQRLNSLDGYIHRYGEKDGKKKWEEKRLKLKEWGSTGSCNIIYYINKGFNEEEAKLELAKRQSTFSLEKCIAKNGIEVGEKIWLERQNKWQKNLYKNGKLKSGYSLISQELFSILIEQYNDNDLGYILYAKKGGEFSLNDGINYFRYDFSDIKNKKIIEYNGDMYHANPNKYKPNDYPHPFRKNITAEEIWNKDKRKVKLANDNGFEVLVIWDSEYMTAKNNVIDKCLNFLKNNGKND